MNRTSNVIWLIIIIIVILGAILYLTYRTDTVPTGTNTATTTPTQIADEFDVVVRSRVVEFGDRLKNVSLLADDVSTQIQTQYGTYLTPELLQNWQSNPTQALGKATSSPWPQRIEVISTEMQNATTYRVNARVVEATSTGVSGTYPITLMMEKRNNVWLIANVTTGAPTSQTP